MKSLVVFDDLTWHDGRILNLEVNLSEKNEISLRVSLLQSLQTTLRNNYSIVAKSPDRFVSSLDIGLILKNHNFGNISDAKLYEDGPEKLVIYLAEGYMEIVAPDIEILAL